jgi:hypothetical protein
MFEEYFFHFRLGAENLSSAEESVFAELDMLGISQAAVRL